MELKQLNEDFTNYKKKQKYENSNQNPNPLPSQRNFDNSGMMDELRNELMIERSQNGVLSDQIEHLQSENYEMKRQLRDFDDICRERD